MIICGSNLKRRYLMFLLNKLTGKCILIIWLFFSSICVTQKFFFQWTFNLEKHLISVNVFVSGIIIWMVIVVLMRRSIPFKRVNVFFFFLTSTRLKQLFSLCLCTYLRLFSHFLRIISHYSSKSQLFDFNLTLKSKKNCKTGPIKKALEPIFDPFGASFLWD